MGTPLLGLGRKGKRRKEDDEAETAMKNWSVKGAPSNWFKEDILTIVTEDFDLAEVTITREERKGRYTDWHFRAATPR